MTTARAAAIIVPPGHLERAGVLRGEAGEESSGHVERAVRTSGTLVGNGSLDSHAVGGDRDGSTAVGSGVPTAVLRGVERDNVVVGRAEGQQQF